MDFFNSFVLVYQLNCCLYTRRVSDIIDPRSTLVSKVTAIKLLNLWTTFLGLVRGDVVDVVYRRSLVAAIPFELGTGKLVRLLKYLSDIRARSSDDVFGELVVRGGGSVEICLYIMQVSINQPTRW